MKNFQQTPKALRLAMAGNKAAFSRGKPKSFQPREAWSTKQAVSGVPLSVLEEKQNGKALPSNNFFYPPVDDRYF